MADIKTNKAVKFIIRYVCITLVALIYAIGISLFLNPNQLAPGGVSGIAIILKEVFPVLPGVGMLILIMNVPIMLLGVWKFGIKFILSTVYTLVVSSVMIDVLPNILKMDAVTKDPMLAAIVGGGLMGLAIGIMFRLETTTGGMDIIIKIIRQKKPHMKTGQLFNLLNCVVLVGSAVAFQNIEVALYAWVAIFVSSIIMNKALYGGDEATLVYIISERRKIIAVRMLEEVDVGATFVQGMGAYSCEPTEVIMCVMRKQTLAKVRNIVKEADPNAFVIVSSANEVFGEGFKDQYKIEM